MPISKENQKRYPFDWPQIRQRILRRAADRCERCGLRNYSVVSRLGERAVFYGAYTTHKEARVTTERLNTRAGVDEHYIVIVLTIAHLRHDVTDSSDEVLAALCQRCHLTHDKVLHATHARATRTKKRLATQPGFWDANTAIV